MPSLRDLQGGFKQAVFDQGTQAIAPHVLAAGIAAEDRLQIYRNNTHILLVDALSCTFPVVCKLVGADFFSWMAKAFIRAHPPTSPCLADYGGNFAPFISTVEQADGLPYLADVARLEWAWQESYNAQDAEALSVETLQQQGPIDYASMSLSLHPSARFVRSDFPVGHIWESNVAGDASASISLAEGPCHILLIRPVADVEVRFLSPGLDAMLRALDAGHTVTEAAGSALDCDPAFDVQRAFSDTLSDGTFCDFIEKTEG